ncbi:MAG: hypothetical protein ACRYG5_06510 [Janthinobacterium lividum]
MKSGAVMTANHMADVIRTINEIAGKRVLIGIPDSSPEDVGGPITNAQIGYIQETGSPAQNIPARPFLVPGVVEIQAQAADILAKGAKGVLDGAQPSIDAALTSAGFVAESSVKEKINSNIQPALAESTLAERRRRGVTRENTLVDTGQMRNAVTHVIRKV